MHTSGAVRARLRPEGTLSISCFAVMSFTRCLPDSAMLLVIFTMLLDPESLHFSYAVHSLSCSWHREGKATHKKEMHVALPVGFWLISVAALPGGSGVKPRGQRAGGRSSAIGTSRCHVCSRPVPCDPSSLCPHPIIGSVSTLIHV